MNELINLGFGRKNRILIVEDSSLLMSVIINTLEKEYDLIPFSDAEHAWDFLEKQIPDLILLDIILPGMSGLELLALLRADPRLSSIPVIMTSSLESIEHKRTAFELSASDYITKPYEPEELRIRVRANLQTEAARRFLSDQNRELERMVKEKTDEIIKIWDGTISALAALAETRDNETGMHIQRTRSYMGLLLDKMQEKPNLKKQLEGKDISIIKKCAPLHDIGKVGVPDSVLLKNGPLTPEERKIVETHTVLGRDAIIKAEKIAGTTTFLEYAKNIAYTHHEKWDGSGYPEKISGRAIPVEGRLMALCDVYDALISKRIYKEAFTHEKSISIMKDGRGKHFDPELLDLFLENEDEILKIAVDMADE